MNIFKNTIGKLEVAVLNMVYNHKIKNAIHTGSKLYCMHRSQIKKYGGDLDLLEFDLKNLLYELDLYNTRVKNRNAKSKYKHKYMQFRNGRLIKTKTIG